MAKLGSRVSKLESAQRSSDFAHLSDEELEQVILELGQRLRLLDEAVFNTPGSATTGDKQSGQMEEPAELRTQRGPTRP